MVFSNNLHIGMKAPNFKATTTFGNLELKDYSGKWLVLFSHPGSFTPVCTTEFLAFASCYDKFKNLDAELLGLSIDSNPSHLAWVQSIYTNSNVAIPFPIIADASGEIASMYDMNHNDTSCVRSVFIIDPKGIIRVILTYPKEVGRNINEIIRILQALQKCDSQNVVTPANWQPNTPAVETSPSTYEDLQQRVLNSQDFAFFDWYLCFKKSRLIGGENNE